MLVASVRQALFEIWKDFPQTLFKVKLKASPSVTNPAVGDKGRNHVAGRFPFVSLHQGWLFR